ncbi:MAG: DUF448 domain-containing protein [Desulfuromonas sp.]|nr:MAG: DUF448 domain-containing protein [Desulfuromonas sp.]
MTRSPKRPQRTCLGCRKSADQDGLLRLVLSPAGELLVDYRQRLPGRGAYVCFSADCLREAVRRRQFSRAFKREVPCVDSQLMLQSLQHQLQEKILGLVGMARKSGQAISGSGQVLDALREGGEVALVLVADDLSAGIREKIERRTERLSVPLWKMYDKERLGQVLGKAQRSVVAVKAGPLAHSMISELSRYTSIVGES